MRILKLQSNKIRLVDLLGYVCGMISGQFLIPLLVKTDFHVTNIVIFGNVSL